MENYQLSLDWEACLALSNNKENLARELLSMFANELPTLRDHINQAFQAKNYSLLSNLLHKLNGACCYCGVPKLKNIVNGLELTLKANPKTPINLTALNSEIENLLLILKKQNLA